ncbi:leucine-rich repeat protein [Olsenella intestinalis]|uniref:leucine-rich repeat protein n=1 Tax=Olsenella intestinalis TaxID=2930083 RepID=UPI00200C45FE|nr:leucine-rich repeat protein [Olsenella intestinalis]
MEHPKLTEDRRERIAARCGEQLESMLAEVKGWYPQGKLTSEELKRGHDNFSKRLGSLASDMGYASFVELLHNEGFDIELDRRAAKNPVGHRIAPEDAVDSIVASVTDKLGGYFEKIDEWYPDRVVTGFARLHAKTKDNLIRQAKMLGYESWADLLRDYGYEVPDYNLRSGRPKSIDPVAIVDELARRYEGREPAPDIGTVRDENPDLASKFKTISNESRAVFGMTFLKVLVERGIVGERSVSHADTDAFLAELESAYAQRDDKPLSIEDLRAVEKPLHPDWGKLFSSINYWSWKYYGKTPRTLLKERGIIAGGTPGRKRKPDLPESEFEAMMARLREKYSHAVRPRTAVDFGEANPEWKSNIKDIKKYLSAHGLGTPSKFLENEQLVSRLSCEESLPRPSDEVLKEFTERASADPHELLASSPNAKLVELDGSIETSKRYDYRYKYFEMLRLGDPIELVSDGVYVHARFCEYDLGGVRFENGKGRELVSKAYRPTEWGLTGGGVYAYVIGISGGRDATFQLRVFYAEDASASTVSQGMLMSVDGKTVLDCDAANLPDRVVVPEGVEAIGRAAFIKTNVCAVSLPSTLRTIGEKAFRKTRLEKVLIPAGVTDIGGDAFSHARASSDFSRWDYDGPVNIDVEKDNPRYMSLRGSLVELDGDIRRLLSCYYKRPRGQSCTIAVPKEVNVLGQGCFTPYDDVYDVRIKVPEGVERIESGCFTALGAYGMDRVELPATLVDIDDYSWLELCGLEAGPFIDGFAEMDDGPIEVYPPSRLRIAKGNPRYLVKDGYAYALPAKKEASGSEVCAHEDDAASADEAFDEVTFRYDGKGKGFAYSFKFPINAEDELGMASEYLDWL